MILFTVFKHLDVLCNNAGIGTVPPALVEGWDHIFFINAIAPFLLTSLLLPLLKKTKSSRIVFVGSEMYQDSKDLNRNELQDINATSTSKRNVMYGYSKLANIYVMKELAKRFKNIKGLESTVIATGHPGIAATPLHRREGNPLKPISPVFKYIFQSSEMGAAPLLFAATDASVKSGDFIGPAGFMHLKGWPAKESIWGIGNDEQLQAKVFSLLEEASGYHYDANM